MKLIDNYKNWYKIWSIYFFILIAISPEIYNMFSSMGLLEDAPIPFLWFIRILAMVGIVSRLVKQEKLKNDNND